MKQTLFSLGLLVFLNGCVTTETKSLYPEKEVSVAYMASSWGQSKNLQIDDKKEICKECYVSGIQFDNKNMKEGKMTAKIIDEG
jgi:hypothetical protein